MEDIKRKAHFDELNKSKDEIGSSPRKYIGVPRPVRCIECGRLFDAKIDKGSGYSCFQYDLQLGRVTEINPTNLGCNLQ